MLYLYLFCGKPRKQSLEAHLAKLAPTYGVPLKVEAVDILRKPFTDLSNLQTQNSFLERVRGGSYFAVILSPPCSTFSRAPRRNRQGPRPIRSYEYPDGLPGLRWAERRKARLGNLLADFSLQCCLLHVAPGCIPVSGGPAQGFAPKRLSSLI